MMVFRLDFSKIPEMAYDVVPRLLLLLSAIHLQTIHCSEMYQFVVSPKALQGHVIKTTSKVSVALCRNDCVWLPWCFSINVRQKSDGMFECELNNSSKKASPTKMASREGWSYHEMANIITSENCKIYECKGKEDFGNGWYRYGNTTIKLFKEKKNWTDARSHCQSLGGDLLSITSSHENDFVHGVFVTQLNLTYLHQGFPDIGIPYDRWRLDGSEPSVQFHGPSGDVNYKSVDGENALYFTGKQGYATIPSINVNAERGTVAFWFKPLGVKTSDEWLHPVNLLNQPSLDPDVSYVFDWNYNPSYQPVMLNFRKTLGPDKHFAYPLSFEYDIWNHIAVTWNTTVRRFRYVIQGVKIVKEVNTFSFTGNEKFLLGTGGTAYASKSWTINGYLKDIVLINKTLLVPEIETFAFWNEHGAWIGLNSLTNDITRWSDGTPRGQFIALKRQPSTQQSGRKCAVIGKDGKWLDKLCNVEYPFICKKPL